MKPTLSVISLNIERSKHLDLVRPYLERGKPDVFCVQELIEEDISFFEGIVGRLVCFAPMVLYPSEIDMKVMGVGIFSRLPASGQKKEYYSGDGNKITDFKQDGLGIMNRVLAYCDIEKGGEIFRIGTTHFTWTPDGSTSDYQRRDLGALLGVLNKAGEIVFTGDFNAPRGFEIFMALAERFKDNVPAEYNDSIDDELHRNKEVELMVDGLFSTPKYSVSDVKMVCGLSDHCALTAKISRSVGDEDAVPSTANVK